MQILVNRISRSSKKRKRLWHRLRTKMYSRERSGKIMTSLVGCQSVATVIQIQRSRPRASSLIPTTPCLPRSCSAKQRKPEARGPGLWVMSICWTTTLCARYFDQVKIDKAKVDWTFHFISKVLLTKAHKNLNRLFHKPFYYHTIWFIKIIFKKH